MKTFAEDMIPYKILHRTALRSIKWLLGIQMDLVDRRLPKEKELAELTVFSLKGAEL